MQYGSSGHKTEPSLSRTFSKLPIVYTSITRDLKEQEPLIHTYI